MSLKKPPALLISFSLVLLILVSPELKADPVIMLTRENPLLINILEGTVSFLAEVNGEYFLTPTRHAAVFAGGTNGDKAVFRALADHISFFEGLQKTGAVPGNNMTFLNREITYSGGSKLKVTVSWEGAAREYGIDEVIVDSNNKPMDMRFGGNRVNAEAKNTGCLICLDSCPVGIASNATYTYGAVEKRGEVKFIGNRNILPPDGTLVVVKVRSL